MTTINDILTELRAQATDERDKGDRFERLMVAFLTTDPLYAHRYAHVWRWADWPGRPHGQDTGIDLVAEERDTGELCAIQCKFYDPAHSSRRPISTRSSPPRGRAAFSNRMIISDHRQVGQARRGGAGRPADPRHPAAIPSPRSTATSTGRSSTSPRPEQLGRRKTRSLRPHQIDAIAASTKASLPQTGAS